MTVEVPRDQGMQRQRIKAQFAWFFLMITAPFFCPFYLIGVFVYQFCMVEGKLSLQAKAVTFVSCVFFAIAWIPPTNLYLLIAGGSKTRDSSTSRINGLAPIFTFYIFCFWGTVVAFRRFKLADSYEMERDRENVRLLGDMLILPEPVRIGGRPFGNALELYEELKGAPPFGPSTAIASLTLSTATVAFVRGVFQEEHDALYTLSTVYFFGMFLVFYATFAYVIVMYWHHVQFIKRLTSSISDGSQIDARNMTHLRAWEHVRRLASMELTSPSSVLNSFFTPSMWLASIASVGIFTYIVAGLLFFRNTLGPFNVTIIALFIIFMCFMILSFVVAKVAQKHFKLHTCIVARKTYDMAILIHERLEDIDRGIDHSDVRSQLKFKVTNVQGELTDDLEEAHATWSSLATYLVANQPRPLILGIELRHVRFVMVFLLLLSGNLLFLSLLVAFKQGACTTR